MRMRTVVEVWLPIFPLVHVVERRMDTSFTGLLYGQSNSPGEINVLKSFDKMMNESTL